MSDLISRQAAIDAANRTDYRGLLVEDVTKVTDEVVKELKKLPSAQPETYGKRTETHARDLISREAAIHLIAGYDGVIDKSVAKRLLIQMPSAQPEIIRCKDCKFYREYGCQRAFVYPEPEDFCSRAERREE